MESLVAEINAIGNEVRRGVVAKETERLAKFMPRWLETVKYTIKNKTMDGCRDGACCWTLAWLDGMVFGDEKHITTTLAGTGISVTYGGNMLVEIKLVL